VQVRYVKKNSHLQCHWRTSKVTNLNTHCKSQTNCAGISQLLSETTSIMEG
jgi:hypothetical protein